MPGKPTALTTRQVLDLMFKDPQTQYSLSDFDNLGKPVPEILNIYAKTVESGRDAGKTKYFLKSFIPFSTGNEEVQVYGEGGKSAPEEIVRQLWVCPSQTTRRGTHRPPHPMTP
jgi:type I restriction enzyme M protein